MFMYQLPILPYLLQDLEPFIDTHTMGLHYHKHEQNYLNKLNELLRKNRYDYRYPLEELIYHIDEFLKADQEDILYNLGGVLNHNLYWKSIHPKPQQPIDKLKEELDKKYGSLDQFMEEMKKMALQLKGSGYTFLVIQEDGELDIVNTSNQDTPLLHGKIPLLNIDMWEHAYYLNVQNNKENYFNNFKQIVDFTNANKIYNSIMK